MDSSLHNFIDQLDTDADSAETLVIFEGTRAAEEGQPREVQRQVAFLTGAVYNPRVSDWSLCNFSHPRDREGDVILPFELELAWSACRVTSTKKVGKMLTSCELLFLLVDQYKFCEVVLYRASYDIIERLDGALTHYRVHAVAVGGHNFVGRHEGSWNRGSL